MAEKKESIEYMGKTFVKSGNTVYYGNIEDGVLLQITTLESKKSQDLDLATKVLVQVVRYGDSSPKILKQSEKNSFYDAFELGSIWLDRALKGSL